MHFATLAEDRRRSYGAVMEALRINACTLTSALGVGMDSQRAKIARGETGLSNAEWYDCSLDTWLGRVKSVDDAPVGLPAEWESRNNRLAELGLQQDGFLTAVAAMSNKWGAHRCGLALGTSTSSIGRTEEGYRQLDADGRFPPAFRQTSIHNPHAPGAYVAQRLGLTGPVATISTACSSSAKAFAAAERWLRLGLADAVVVGGVDSLCQSVIHGFNSLQLVDSNLCRPFDTGREGINLGEAAGFALLTRAASDAEDDTDVQLRGYGESSDAHHMSSAHPDGLGAELAMTAALKKAGLAFSEIDYVNLHGTGTRTNDDIEGRLCARLLDERTVCSSTKGYTGHTLGAAGICEAILTIDALRQGVAPGNINVREPEPVLADRLITTNHAAELRHAMSNSFGFGGNNCSLIFAKA